MRLVLCEPVIQVYFTMKSTEVQTLGDLCMHVCSKVFVCLPVFQLVCDKQLHTYVCVIYTSSFVSIEIRVKLSRVTFTLKKPV